MTDFYILSLKWTRSGEECVTWFHSLVSETLGVSATIIAPWEHPFDDDGKPYECRECEQRPTHKGPSKLIVHRPKLEAVQ